MKNPRHHRLRNNLALDLTRSVARDPLETVHTIAFEFTKYLPIGTWCDFWEKSDVKRVSSWILTRKGERDLGKLDTYRWTATVRVIFVAWLWKYTERKVLDTEEIVKLVENVFDTMRVTFSVLLISFSVLRVSWTRCILRRQKDRFSGRKENTNRVD